MKRTRFSCGEKRILGGEWFPVGGSSSWCSDFLPAGWQLIAHWRQCWLLWGIDLQIVEMANGRLDLRSEVDQLLTSNGRIKLLSVTSALKTRSLAEFLLISSAEVTCSIKRERASCWLLLKETC